MTQIYPANILTEEDLIILLAKYSSANMHNLMNNRVWPLIKERKKLIKSRKGPAPAMTSCYMANGHQLTSTEFKRQVAGMVLWQILNGEWAKIEKTVIGHSAQWAIIEKPAVPPFPTE